MRRAFLLGLAALLWLNASSQTVQQWRDSLSVLARAITKSPQSVDLRLKKAAVNLELSQWEYAVEEYDRVLEMESNNLTALYFRAFAHSQLHHYEPARIDYQKILSLVPKNFEALLGLAMVNRKMGQTTETMDELNMLVQLFPDSAYAYAARAAFEEEQKQYEPALYDWGEAMRLNPENNDFLVSKVELLLKQNRRQEARKLLNDAIKRGVPRQALKEWLYR